MKQHLSLITALTISTFANISIDWSSEYKTNLLDINSTINSIAVLQNGDIISVGKLNGSELLPLIGIPPSTPDQNSFVMKTESNNTQVWFKQFGMPIFPDEAIKVLPRNENSYIVIGTTINIDSSVDIYISELNSTGDSINLRLIGTQGRDYPQDAVIDSLGNIYIAGISDGNFSDLNNSLNILFDNNKANSNYSKFIIKLDTEFNLTTEKMFEDNFESDFQGKDIHLKINEINMTEEIYAVYNNLSNGSSIQIDVIDLNLSTKINNIYSDISNKVISFDFNKDLNNSTNIFLLTKDKITKIPLSTDGILADNNSQSVLLSSSITNLSSIKYVGLTNSLYLVGTDYFDYKNSIILSKYSAKNLDKIITTHIGNSAEETTNSLKTTDIQIHNKNLYISGLLNNITFQNTTNTNPNGNGAFLIKINDNFANIDLIQGWNLISGTFRKENFPQDVLFIYSYSVNNPNLCESDSANRLACQKSWSAFSPDISLNNTLHNLANIPDILEMNNSQGLWIYSDKNISINAGYNNLNISTSNYSDGWSLGGIGVDISSVDSFACKNNSNHSAIIWTFKNNNWLINNLDNSYFPTVTRFEDLKANSGFWVNCKLDD